MAKTTYPSYTVSQITVEITGRLKTIGPIVLVGEISGWRLYPSGHGYFTLKDSAAQISCVVFSSDLQRIVAKVGDVLKDGAKVELFGSVTVYANRGNYQFVARSARLVGVGDLMQRYLALREKLRAEGLFDAARKRPLPHLPRRIGLVTSEAGAVVHDMCTVLLRRFPNLHVRLFPCLVQGAEAPAAIRAGLAYFNRPFAEPDACGPDAFRADLVIVARGGGSFEDLFCFNDEQLVRDLAASRVPTVSAVGHETDYTLCDFAADVRAGTPSIAAELAVPVLADLLAALEASDGRLVRSLRAKGEFFAQRVDQLGDALGASLAMSLARAQGRLERLEPRLAPALTLRLAEARARLEKAEAKLVAYSPYGVLSRGYSLTTAADGSVVRSAASLKPGDVVTTRLADGTFDSTVCANFKGSSPLKFKDAHGASR